MHELAQSVAIFIVEDLAVHDEIDLQEHVLSVAHELRTHFAGALVRFELGVLLARVQPLLVGVNLCLDLARSDQVGELPLDDFEWQTKRT